MQVLVLVLVLVLALVQNYRHFTRILVNGIGYVNKYNSLDLSVSRMCRKLPF